MLDEVNLDDLRACAAEAVQSWSLDVRSLEFVAARENAVFRVDTAGGISYALRVHRPGYHSLAELESEIEWTTALVASGIEVPHAVRTRAGTWYATVPFGDSGDTRQVGLNEWIDGTPLDALLGSTDPIPLYRELGSLMARLHNQSEVWTPGPGFVRHALDANGLIGDSPWWGQFWDIPEMSADQSKVVTAARHNLLRWLVAFGTESPTFGLIHADLLPENVLVRKGRPVVIDFDDAAWGWHHYDMTVATVRFVDSEQMTALRAALLEGYRRERSFSTEDEAMLPQFMVIRRLVELGWLNTRVAETLQLSTDRRVLRQDLMSSRIEVAVEACRNYLGG